MKKTTQFFGLMCMAAVLAMGTVSCKKENAKTVSSFDISLPTLEGDDPFDGSKAYIDLVDGGRMKWYQGDNVMMYSIDADYTKSQIQEFVGDAATGDALAHFAGYSMPVGSEGFFAFYPASKAIPKINAGNRATFIVGDTQDCGATDLFAGTAYAGKIYLDPRGYVGAATCDVIEPYANFTLSAIFGYLNVRLKDSGNSGKRIKSVTIIDDSKYLTGSMSINIPALKSADLAAMKQLGVNYKSDGDMNAYLPALNAMLQEVGYNAQGTGNQVTFDCSKANGGDGVQIISSNKYFFIPLRPGALIDSFKISLEYFNADNQVISVPANKKYIMIPGYNTNITIDIKTGSIQ